MLLYYRRLGLVVLARPLRVGRAASGRSSRCLGETQGLALTLAGVTGIIVSIGVTVDSYVVYFERLKDEVRAGRDAPRRRPSAASPAPGARSSPPTSSSLIGAAVLWYLTVGSVRGFAFFLGLSTVLDLDRRLLLHPPGGDPARPQPAGFTEAATSFGVAPRLRP